MLSQTAIWAENLLVRDYKFNLFHVDDRGFRMFGKGKFMVVVYHDGRISACNPETAEYWLSKNALVTWLIKNNVTKT